MVYRKTRCWVASERIVHLLADLALGILVLSFTDFVVFRVLLTIPTKRGKPRRNERNIWEKRDGAQCNNLGRQPSLVGLSRLSSAGDSSPQPHHWLVSALTSVTVFQRATGTLFMT